MACGASSPQHKYPLAAHEAVAKRLRCSDNGGKAGIMDTTFRPSNVRLQDLHFLGHCALGELAPTSHDRQLRGKRQLGEESSLLKSNLGMHAE